MRFPAPHNAHTRQHVTHQQQPPAQYIATRTRKVQRIYVHQLPHDLLHGVDVQVVVPCERPQATPLSRRAHMAQQGETTPNSTPACTTFAAITQCTLAQQHAYACCAGDETCASTDKQQPNPAYWKCRHPSAVYNAVEHAPMHGRRLVLSRSLWGVHGHIMDIMDENKRCNHKNRRETCKRAVVPTRTNSRGGTRVPCALNMQSQYTHEERIHVPRRLRRVNAVHVASPGASMWRREPRPCVSSCLLSCGTVTAHTVWPTPNRVERHARHNHTRHAQHTLTRTPGKWIIIIIPPS